MLTLVENGVSTNILEGRFDTVQAVGDGGCLGRKCNLDDKQAHKDIDSWMNNFLDKGEHAGHP